MNCYIKDDLIKEYLKKEKLSREQFCKIAGITEPTLRRVENGHENVRLITLIRIAETINVSLGDLIKNKNVEN